MNIENINQSFFSRERIRGFVYAFAAFAVLEVTRQLILTTSPWYSAGIPSLLGAVIFFTALLSLNNQQYKQYAQGALVGWLVFGAVAMGIKIAFTV